MADSDHSSTPGKSPAFQFYPKDFLTDENVRMMSLQERGAYITLICQCWTEGTLPADVAWLARLCGTPLTAFRRLWPAIERCFRNHPTEADRLVHPRLEKELEKQAEYRRRQADKGRASGASRLNRKATETNRGSLPVQPVLVQPKTNSSISDLQSSDSSQLPRKEREVGRARDAGLMAGAKPINHGDCLAHGPVCFKPRFAEKYLLRFGGNHEAMVAWARGVCEAWSERVHNGEHVPYGDDFVFWAAAYDETFKPVLASGPNVSNEDIAAHISKSLQEKPVRNAR